MPGRDLLARLTELAVTTADRASAPDLRQELLRIVTRLEEPIQVAVAGRMKAGKSTLVNALLGRQIAPTAATECTKVVARYVYADVEAVRVTPVSGTTYSVAPSSIGGPPDDLGRTAEEIDHITVAMTTSRRRDYTLVDTPGLDSASDGVSATTERSLLGDPASARAVSQVDGLLYLMPHPGDGDVNFLREFATVFDGSRLGAINILGVLSKIDQLDDAGRSDPREAAGKLATRKGEELLGCVDRVVPVSGLVAQAALAGGFREHHTTWIRRLAESEPTDLRQALRGVQRFLQADHLRLEEHARVELVRAIGLWGVGEAVLAFRGGTVTTIGLIAHLRELSNIDELVGAINGRLFDGAALVRTASALADMERVVYRAADGRDRTLRDGLVQELAEIRATPAFHRITEIQVLRRFDPERSRLSDAQKADVNRVLRESDARAKLCISPTAGPGEVREAAAEKAREWRGVENGPRTRRPDQATAAVLRRTYELLAAGEQHG
jgi:hypothetical protein